MHHDLGLWINEVRGPLQSLTDQLHPGFTSIEIQRREEGRRERTGACLGLIQVRS